LSRDLSLGCGIVV